MQRVGSRAQVMHGNAKMTGGGLRKKDLKYNKQGKIVSKKMSKLAKKEKRLQKAGYTTRKGQFGAAPKPINDWSIDDILEWVNNHLEEDTAVDEIQKNKLRGIFKKENFY